MRHALPAGCLVRRPHAIGNLTRHNGSGIVLYNRNLKTIGEAIVLERKRASKRNIGDLLIGRRTCQYLKRQKTEQKRKYTERITKFSVVSGRARGHRPYITGNDRVRVGDDPCAVPRDQQSSEYQIFPTCATSKKSLALKKDTRITGIADDPLLLSILPLDRE